MLEKTKEATENVVDKTAKMASEATKSAKDAIGDLGNLNLDSLKTDFAGMFDGLTGKLGNITSAAGAEELLPDLKGYSSKLDSLSKTMIALPAEGKTMITELIKSQMDKINPILEKITGIPDIGETVLKVIEQIKDKLKSFAS